MKTWLTSVLLCTAVAWLSPVHAQSEKIVVGINLSLTGPAASLGTLERNALDFAPKSIGGVPLELVVLDDGSDRWTAGTNARRLVTESKADVLIGSTTTPGSLAMALVANESRTPQFAISPMSITPARQKWSFVATHSVTLLGKALYEHMRANNVKRVAYLGYNEPYGDIWFNDLDGNSEGSGLRIVDDQRFARADTSITGQVLQLLATGPDAVLVGASGAVTALPQSALRRNGFKGVIYQTQGAANPDFIRLSGGAAEGVVIAASPMMDAENLPADSLIRPVALEFNKQYEAKYGPGSRNTYSARTYDVFKILERAIPLALKVARPGSAEFRDALRKAVLQSRDIAGTCGVYNYTESDRYGQDQRSRILVTVKDGKFIGLGKH